MLPIVLLIYASALLFNRTYALPTYRGTQQPLSSASSTHDKDTRVLILGGGVASITAARALHDAGVTDFVVLEARAELGGRLMSHTFGAPGRQHTVELGANWVQGTRTGDGPENPIWTLARKHGLKTAMSTYFDGLTTFDERGQVDFLDVVEKSSEDFDRLVASAGTRVNRSLVDASARTGYSMIGARPKNAHEMASEYYQFDWEFTASPEEASWVASAWVHLFLQASPWWRKLSHNNNYTFSTFSEENALCIDRDGFKKVIQREAADFLQDDQLRLNSTVSVIERDGDGVTVILENGEVLTADYLICTSSLGVLQHGDVRFDPPLPAWKREALHSMTMGVYTKLFLQFPRKFWFDTEHGLYADSERGRYPVWQSLDHPKFLPGSGILVGTVTGSFSRRIEALPRARVLDEVLSVLRTMYPNTTIPTPLDFHLHSWGTDPLFRGSYATWPPSFTPEHHTNLRADIDRRIWFAGEATSIFHFGYLQGAYFEGQEIGMKVAECIQGAECAGLTHYKHVFNASPYVD